MRVQFACFRINLPVFVFDFVTSGSMKGCNWKLLVEPAICSCAATSVAWNGDKFGNSSIIAPGKSHIRPSGFKHVSSWSEFERKG